MSKESHTKRGRPRVANPKQVLSIAFDVETLEALEALAERLSITKGEIVRQATQRYIRREKRRHERQASRQSSV